MNEWCAYINSTLYASAKTLKALLAYLNAHVPELEQRVTINFDGAMMQSATIDC